MAIFFSVVKSGRYKTQEEYKHFKDVNDVEPRFGFIWWYWKPNILLMPKNSLTIFEFKWLNFIFEIGKF